MTLLVMANRLRNGMEGGCAGAAKVIRGDGATEEIGARDVHGLSCAWGYSRRCPDAERVAVDRDQHGLLETGEPLAELGTRDGIHVPDCTSGYNA